MTVLSAKIWKIAAEMFNCEPPCRVMRDLWIGVYFRLTDRAKLMIEQKPEAAGRPRYWMLYLEISNSDGNPSEYPVPLYDGERTLWPWNNRLIVQ